MLTVGKEYRFLVVVANHWAKGVTEEEAIKHIRQIAGRSVNTKTRLVYLVDPTTRLTGMGDMEWFDDESTLRPILVRKVKNGKDVNPAEVEV